MNSSKNRGFTLIELLIVISIIAILSAIGLVMYGQVTKNARDAKRMSDLKFIQSALEDYHADTLHYPANISFGGALSEGGRTYMTQVPNDPISSRQYYYSPSGSGCGPAVPRNCTGYCLFANIESNPPSSASDSICRSYPAGGYNFGITRP